MSAFSDARAVPAGSIIETDIAIIGGGAAGITLALALVEKPIRVLMLESGGTEFDAKTQSLYAGTLSGANYLSLQNSRMRFLGGSSNHWGGWCRPLDESDFDVRSWVPHSGWPFSRKEIEPYFPRAQAFVEAGKFEYDKGERPWADKFGAPVKLGEGGVYTSWFQFSKMRGAELPTNFAQRYGGDLKHQPHLTTMLHANVTNIGLAADANSVDHLDIATLSGNKFKVKAKYVVVAAGGIENARLLLASNDVAKQGIGNDNDLVGRFFADHPIPRQTAKLVLFNGDIASYYTDNGILPDAIFRAAFSPTEAYKQQRHVMGSLTTVENKVELDEFGQAAVSATASALGVDGGNAKVYALGCGMELKPDPERRFTLTHDRDALGVPRLKLHMTIYDEDFALYRETMTELGRQLLAARTGMIHLDRSARESWLQVLDWGNHHLGTTRMSNDPRQGVVDANSKVFGVGNLYVAGSSVFPTYGSSNPTLNLIALTLRLARHLKGQFV